MHGLYIIDGPAFFHWGRIPQPCVWTRDAGYNRYTQQLSQLIYNLHNVLS